MGKPPLTAATPTGRTTNVNLGEKNYRPSQAAEAVGVSRDVIDRAIARRELRHFKLGTARKSAVIIPESALAEWLAQFEVPVGGRPASGAA